MAKQYVRRAIQAWFDPPEVARIDQFRRGQNDPSWAEAIRELVEAGLAATEKRKRSAAGKADDSKATIEELQEDFAA